MKEKELVAQLRRCEGEDQDVLQLVQSVFGRSLSMKDKENLGGTNSGELAKEAVSAVKTLQFILSALPKLKQGKAERFVEAAEFTVGVCVTLRPCLKLKNSFTVELLYQKFISILIARNKFDRSLSNIKKLLLILSPGLDDYDSSRCIISRLPEQEEEVAVVSIFVFCLYNACRCLVEIGNVNEALSLGEGPLRAWLKKMERCKAAQYAKCCLSLFYGKAPAELQKDNTPFKKFDLRKLALLIYLSVLGPSRCETNDLLTRACKASIALEREEGGENAAKVDFCILEFYTQIWTLLGFSQVKGLPTQKLVKASTPTQDFSHSCEFLLWFEHYITVTLRLEDGLCSERLLTTLIACGSSWKIPTDAIEATVRLHILAVSPLTGMKTLPKLRKALVRLGGQCENSLDMLSGVCKAFEKLSGSTSMKSLGNVESFRLHISTITKLVVAIAKAAKQDITKAVLVLLQALPLSANSIKLDLEKFAVDEIGDGPEQLQLISTVCYNNGVKLYNSSEYDQALPHFQLSCDALVKVIETDAQQTWQKFVEVMKPERWQILGLIYDKLGSDVDFKEALSAWSVLCLLTLNESAARSFTRLRMAFFEDDDDPGTSILETFVLWWKLTLPGVPLALDKETVTRVVRLECKAYKRSLVFVTFRRVTHNAVNAAVDTYKGGEDYQELAALVRLDLAVLTWSRYAQTKDDSEVNDAVNSLLSAVLTDIHPVLAAIVRAWRAMMCNPEVADLETLHEELWEQRDCIPLCSVLVQEEVRRCCTHVVSFAKLHGYAVLLSKFLRLSAFLQEEQGSACVVAANCFLEYAWDDSLASMMAADFTPETPTFEFTTLLLSLQERNNLQLVEEVLRNTVEERASSQEKFMNCWQRSLLYSLQFCHSLALQSAEEAFRLVTKAPQQEGIVSRFCYWLRVLSTFYYLGILWEQRGDPRSAKYFYEQERIQALQRVQVFKIRLAKIGLICGKVDLAASFQLNALNDSAEYEWFVECEAQILQNMLKAREGKTSGMDLACPDVSGDVLEEIQWWVDHYKHCFETVKTRHANSRGAMVKHEGVLRCIYAAALLGSQKQAQTALEVYQDVVQYAQDHVKCLALYGLSLAKLALASSTNKTDVLSLLEQCTNLSRKLCDPRSIMQSHRLLASANGDIEKGYLSFAPALALERAKKLEMDNGWLEVELDEDLLQTLGGAREEFEKQTRKRCDDFSLCLWSLYSPTLACNLAGPILRLCLDNYLPADWVTCSICSSENQRKLLFIRERQGHRPLFIERNVGSKLCAWLKELKRLVHDCEATTKGITAEVAQSYTKEQKIEWWERRGHLDRQFQEHLVDFERNCLGPCRLLLYPPPSTPPPTLRVLKCCEKLLEKHSGCNDQAREMLILILESLDQVAADELNPTLAELLGLQEHPGLCTQLSSLISPLFSANSNAEDANSRSQDGVEKQPRDMLVKELRAELSERGLNTRGLKKDLVKRLEEAIEEELEEGDKAEKGEGEATFGERANLIVVLSEKLLPVPLESLPICSSLGVTRMPSISFIVEHALRRRFLPQTRRLKPGTFIVDPKGDLPSTRKTFEPIVRKLRKRFGWSGILAEKPSRETWEEALGKSATVLYCGHGAAEEFFSRERVAELSQCAVTFLMGCSSGKLLDQGEFEPAGVAWSYLVAGCPSLLCSLWDVTDQDIDRFTVKLVQAAVIDREDRALGCIIKDAREQCKLRYLVGAAPVCYGVPLTLAD